MRTLVISLVLMNVMLVSCFENISDAKLTHH